MQTLFHIAPALPQYSVADSIRFILKCHYIKSSNKKKNHPTVNTKVDINIYTWINIKITLGESLFVSF